MNIRCDKRQSNGCCGRSYPCSECVVPALKELANRFESGDITYGEVPTYIPNDVIPNPYPNPDGELAVLEALATFDKYKNCRGALAEDE